jgi:malate/lactate dehydrogenase
MKGICMISIIGASKVLSAAAFSILSHRINDVVLVDIFKDLAEGEALDMRQAQPTIEFDGIIKGNSDYEKQKDWSL